MPVPRRPPHSFYFSLPRPPAGHPGGVHLPGVAGLPIPSTRLAQRPAACLTGAFARAVHLSAVAAATDNDLGRQPPHRNRQPDSGTAAPASQTRRRRTPPSAGYSSCIRAQHGAGHGADAELRRLSPAPCLPAILAGDQCAAETQSVVGGAISRLSRRAAGAPALVGAAPLPPPAHRRRHYPGRPAVPDSSGSSTPLTMLTDARAGTAARKGSARSQASLRPVPRCLEWLGTSSRRQPEVELSYDQLDHRYKIAD